MKASCEDKVNKIELYHSNNFGFVRPEEYRLSIYFDHNKDNHHVRFKADCSRGKIANLLKGLSELIMKPAIDQSCICQSYHERTGEHIGSCPMYQG